MGARSPVCLNLGWMGLFGEQVRLEDSIVACSALVELLLVGKFGVPR